jgi:riboflavin kinase/FMN adenylyltransferase
VQLIRSLDNLAEAFRHGAVSVGNFDGVHQGHARIVGRLVRRARQAGGPAVIFTMDPHPARVLRPDDAPPPLTWIDRKAELLAELGVDAVIAYPTDRAFLDLDARSFFDQIVHRRLEARAMVEGTNFFFGRGRQGNVGLLAECCRDAGVTLELVEPVTIDGQIVSSSLVRSLVAGGDVEQARRMLTRPYRLRGMVVRGAGRGAGLGYPTANLAGVSTLLPAEGIYAGHSRVGGTAWPAAISIGPNPTFDDRRLKVEVYLIGFRGDLYDRPLEVDLLARLRAVERFTSVEELLGQMGRDVAAAQAVAAGCPDRAPLSWEEPDP